MKPVDWIGSSRKDLRAFPAPVQDMIGYALYRAQEGKLHPSAKPLRGFSGAGVVEIVEDFRTDTFRVVYTVRFAERIYVLHAFQKKSKRGVATPRHEIDLVRMRLKAAQDDYDARKGAGR